MVDTIEGGLTFLFFCHHFERCRLQLSDCQIFYMVCRSFSPSIPPEDHRLICTVTMSEEQPTHTWKQNIDGHRAHTP